MSADRLPYARPLAGRTLLVLAASVQQVPLIRRARALGARVVTLDNRPDNPGHALADACCDADVRDIDAVLAAMATHGAHGILAAATDVAVATAAAVGARLGIVAPPPAAIGALLPKAGFRALQDALDLPAPRWAMADGMPPPGPWIVKPNQASGSRGVMLVEDAAALAPALAAAAGESLDRLAVVETALPGTHHTAEGWLRDGRVAAALVTDRLTAAPPHVATLGHRLPGSLPPAAEAALFAQIERVFAHLGYRDGPFDADLVHGPSGPVLLELSPRAGGNALMRLVEAATGADQMGLLAAHALGLRPHPGRWQVRPAAVEILADAQGGRLSYDPAAIPALHAEPWVAGLELDLPPGAAVLPFTNGRARIGEAVVTGASRAEVEARLAELRARLALAIR